MATAKKKAAGKKTAKKAAKKAPAKKASKSAAKKGGSAKKASKKAAPKKAAAKRTPNASFMRPMQPDDALGAVVGTQPQPRTEITKRIWDYIRKNKLQDQTNKRMINADDKLRAVFNGKSQVSMFDMTKLVNSHLQQS